MFQLLLIGHVLLGLAALGTMLVILLRPKGGPLHRRLGWIYLAAMTLVVASSVVLCLLRLLADETSVEQQHFAFFLLYISLLTTSSGVQGLRALRQENRKRKEISRSVPDWIAPLLLLWASFVLGSSSLRWYMRGEAWLFPAFAGLGVFLALRMVHYWVAPPSDKAHWWVEHLSAMITCCIATTTAFAVTALPRLVELPDNLVQALWFLPTLLLLPLMSYFEKAYRKNWSS